ncbi:hypothetical protein A3D83_03530 [Candidatus Daviesbacteria bacterium RIFCSPHIGHO2_02_FULL_41_10]|uniref:Phosphoglycerate mutase n=1 Tax=Candidatus Daviesbacteria bacterium RIFCSPHIGHO2_02_FULL_41_10 TaxID=1797774 RepID=A0A1F5JUU6_9BACT|nr:MAG: hypothetical protein A3D83_03530 [Candidatus Daviesbacteria bacterium RIFCSPHIGHO2_02_FULL_41_10]
MKVFSIRHGEQLFPHNNEGKKLICGVDASLVELGKQQMQELGREFIRNGIVLDAIYRSPLLRAAESANELADGQTVQQYVIEDLKETFPNSGEGHSYDELEERGGDIYAHPFSPDQETLDHLVKRSREAARRILADAKEYGFESIAIIGHGDPLCALDWVLRHEGQPASYAAMRDSYYPQKAQAKEYHLNSDLVLESEGRIITTEAATQSIEGFRNVGNTEAKI